MKRSKAEKREGIEGKRKITFCMERGRERNAKEGEVNEKRMER